MSCATLFTIWYHLLKLGFHLPTKPIHKINWYKYTFNSITGNTSHSTKQVMTDGRIPFGTIYQSAHIFEKGAKRLMQQVTSGPLQMKINIPTKSWWEYKYQFYLPCLSQNSACWKTWRKIILKATFAIKECHEWLCRNVTDKRWQKNT